MSRRPALDPFESDTTAARAAKESLVGDVLSMKPGAPPLHPLLASLASPPADFDRRTVKAQHGVRQRARTRLRKAGIGEVHWPDWTRVTSASGTRRAPARKSARTKATAAPPAGQDAAGHPLAQAPGKPAEAAHEHDPVVRVVELGALTLAAGIVLAGAYIVLYAVTVQLNPGLPGALRAAVPLCTEMLCGAAVHWCATHRGTVSAWLRVPFAVACLVVISGCIRAELTAAAAAPAAAARARVDAALNAPQPSCEVKLSEPPANEGPQAKRLREENEGRALALQQECLASARQHQAAATANAQAVAPGEAELPRLLSLLGAVGSAAFLPLLTAFIKAARQHSRAGGVS